ncbi:carboxypeptidase-like regulatory domain-containing protein [Fulvivirga maritima]|uniref:carboxypeptidase-like regulatory domain-containing protein n=1 Tax=Fulvivirga maritima TaxID=2904247 RepID=UPI001F268639|nr:carboxypeptidase-like regulatory domain-containing protein [Fulvivirga maritima]UII25376.1 carboxypeptidase-like regulatory domain-containing protein [Fulvivirga maritima]
MVSSFVVSYNNQKAIETSASSNLSVTKAEFISVSGTVISGNGTPLAQASILSTDNNQVVNTNPKGQFIITAPVNGHLKVTCNGYNTMSVTINNSSSLLIMLQPES